MTNMLQRFLSSIFILLIVTFSILARVEIFNLMLLLLFIATTVEWFNIKFSKQIYVISILTVLFTAIYYILSVYFNFWTCVVGSFWWFVALFILFNYVSNEKLNKPLGKVSYFIYGLFTLIPAFISIGVLRNIGVEYIVLLLCWVCSSDIGGYLAGRKFGKNPLLSKVSPGKTIEGCLGGFLLMIVVTSIFYFSYAIGNYSLLECILAGALIIFFAIIGDLFESMIKRRFSIKDSSNIIPGHGGLLDRLDSLFAAAPIFAFMVMMLNMNV